MQDKENKDENGKGTKRKLGAREKEKMRLE